MKLENVSFAVLILSLAALTGACSRAPTPDAGSPRRSTNAVARFVEALLHPSLSRGREEHWELRYDWVDGPAGAQYLGRWVRVG